MGKCSICGLAWSSCHFVIQTEDGRSFCQNIFLNLKSVVLFLKNLCQCVCYYPDHFSRLKTAILGDPRLDIVFSVMKVEVSLFPSETIQWWRFWNMDRKHSIPRLGNICYCSDCPCLYSPNSHMDDQGLAQELACKLPQDILFWSQQLPSWPTERWSPRGSHEGCKQLWHRWRQRNVMYYKAVVKRSLFCNVTWQHFLIY